MRAILLTAASALVLATGACAPRVNYAARTALDCPDRQGELERTSISADRKTCTYRASQGVDVTLQLTPVNGTADQTLAAIETSLTAPATAAAASKPAETPAPPTPPKPPAPPSDDAAKAAQEASEDAGASDKDWSSGSKSGVTVNGKGVVVAEGDRAHINLPGLHIEAGDRNAKVNIGGIRIDAADDEATVHVIRDVRLRGEAFSRAKNGVRATFIAKRDNLPDGYRFVGYQAAGPKTGPLTVAIVKSREELDNGNHLYHDVERLVRRNGGA